MVHFLQLSENTGELYQYSLSLLKKVLVNHHSCVYTRSQVIKKAYSKEKKKYSN